MCVLGFRKIGQLLNDLILDPPLKSHMKPYCRQELKKKYIYIYIMNIFSTIIKFLKVINIKAYVRNFEASKVTKFLK